MCEEFGQDLILHLLPGHRGRNLERSFRFLHLTCATERQLSQCWTNAMIWLRAYPKYKHKGNVLFWTAWCFGDFFQAVEPQQWVEALPQIRVVRPCSGSIHLASTLQKSSVSLRWGHQSRCSRRSPLEPAPVIPSLLWAKTKWPHCCFSSVRNLKRASVKAMTGLYQKTPFCSLWQRHPGDSSGWWLWLTVCPFSQRSVYSVGSATW